MPQQYVGKTCPYCQYTIKSDAVIAVCSDCGIPHHKECWLENNGCTTFACRGTLYHEERDYVALFKQKHVRDVDPIALPQLVPGTVLQEKYLLGAALSRGSYAFNYVAFDLNHQHLLVIKEYFPRHLVSRAPGTTAVILNEPAEQVEYENGLTLFLNEAETLTRLAGQDTIVGVLDYFSDHGTAYMVMHYVEGPTLETFLSQYGGRMEAEKAFTFFLPLLGGLGALHEEGIVHSDINPGHLLVAPGDKPVLIGFGASRLKMREPGKTMALLPNTCYVAEEQYRFSGVRGPWTDIYALGASLYRAVTGLEPPEALDRLSGETMTPPSHLGIEIKPHWESALLKACAVRATDRYLKPADFKKRLTGEGSAPAQITVIGAREARPEEEAGGFSAPERGNSVGNIVNLGFAASKGDRVYYRNSEDGNRLAMIEAGGSESVRINNDCPWFINVIGDWVYYRNDSDGSKIYRAYLDGSGKERVNDAHSSYINARSDAIFYSNCNDGYSIYSVGPGGGNERRIVGDAAWFINVVDDWIYYSNCADTYKIYKVRLDGSDRVLVNEDDSAFINVVDGWIYYRNWSDRGKLYKVRIDGSEKTALNEDSSWHVNVCGDWIYYCNQDDDMKVYRIGKDGAERTGMNDHVSRYINIVGEWLYYQRQDDHGKMYRMRIDAAPN